MEEKGREIRRREEERERASALLALSAQSHAPT